MGTIQVDYNLPERFELEYVDSDNSRKRPVMIHRAPFGSLERFIGVLIEHFAGDFPLWLAPLQCIVLPITDTQLGYAKVVAAELSSSGVLRHVCLGAAAALVSLLLVAGTVGRQAAPLTIGVLGVVWTVLYAGVLLTRSHPRLQPVAGPALAGAGITLILAPPLSIPSVVEACERWVRAAPESGVFAMVLVLFAAGYTAGPLMIGALTFGRPGRGPRIAEEATLSGVYALLIAPAVYLECALLPLDVTALWMAGAILGAALGGPAGLRVGTWLRQPV